MHLSVLLKWRSHPISQALTLSESFKKLTGDPWMAGIALGNIIMKRKTGIYHAKFCIKQRRFGSNSKNFWWNFRIFSSFRKIVAKKFDLLNVDCPDTGVGIQIGVGLEQEIKYIVVVLFLILRFFIRCRILLQLLKYQILRLELTQIVENCGLVMEKKTQSCRIISLG